MILRSRKIHHQGDAQFLDLLLAKAWCMQLGSTLEDKSVYAKPEDFWRDLAKVYVDELWALDRLGCTYLQIDDTMFATLGDPDYRRKLSRLAGAQDQLHMTYIRLLNDALAQKPPAMTVCVHTCRGNHRSAWVAAGG